MSESKNISYFTVQLNDNNASKAAKKSPKDESHEDLIRDLTSDSFIILEDALSNNNRGQQGFPSDPTRKTQQQPPAEETVASAAKTQTRELRSVDVSLTVAKNVSKVSPGPMQNVERLDHDYLTIMPQKAGTPARELPTIRRNDKATILRAAGSCVPKLVPLSQGDRPVITRVKNINELKKVTPRIKLITAESKNITPLSKISMTANADNPSSAKTPRPQLQSYCCTCAGLKLPLVDIFSEKGIQMRLAQQLKHLEEMKNEDGTLSTQMCMDCICDLKMSYKFFMQIKKAQMKLRSISYSLQGDPATQKVSPEDEKKSRPVATVKVTENSSVTIFPTKKSVNEEASSSKSSSLKKVDESEISSTRTEENLVVNAENPQNIETQSVEEFSFHLSDDNESIEEFDPDDPLYSSDASENRRRGSTGKSANSKKKEGNNSVILREASNEVESSKNDRASPMGSNSANRQEIDTDRSNVYQYDPKLNAYVKMEMGPAEALESEKTKSENDPEVQKKDTAKQPNILKRKSPGNFFGSPVACVKKSDSMHVKSGKRDVKKPKLNVENAVNVTEGNEDGIMYVTVKGSKPNELLLVKVKKMDKQVEKKDEKKKLDASPVEKMLKKLDDPKKEEFNRPKAYEKREQIIEEQIEEYKKKRAKILGGGSGVPNPLKFEDGAIRFVNPLENNEKSAEVQVIIQTTEGSEGAGEGEEDSKFDIVDLEKHSNLQENPENSTIKEEPEDCDSAGEYLERLARLKKKWEEAKRIKEETEREPEESSSEGNMEKLSRVLGSREKNLAEFQEYLKQRGIVINRLSDEVIVTLYEDRSNPSGKKKFPDLIDESTPLDYIEEENYLECDYCPETFGHKDVLEEHLKSHDYKLMYWCEDCQIEFPTIKTKRNHNAGCIRKLTCRYCDLLLESKGKKRQHEQKHVDSIYGQICDVCGEKFKHQATLDQHFKTQHMSWEKVFQCSKCPKKFAFKQKLKFHLKSVHTTYRAYLCEDCGADFKNPASLRHHRIRKHHPTGNKRECPVCNKMLPFYSLSKHMYTHKAYTIKCPHCDKMFKNTSTLKQHVRIHEDQRQYRCDTCGVGFNRRDGLRLHLKVHQKSGSRALKECSCQICSEKFPNHSMLVIHRNRVHKDGKQYTCHICNRSMLSLRSLDWHMSHIHNEEPRQETDKQPEKKRVSCEHCDKTFKTDMILKNHIKNTHVEKDPSKCPDCAETFPSDVRLRHHMMVVHNRLEGTLTCPHCPKRFVNQLRLKTHMISHSEDRPYTCEICGFNLKTKIQLIKHHQNRHSDERPLQCRYCPWRCKQVSALVCHERTHTNERPYSCIVCRQRFKYLGDKNKHERRHESLGGSGFKRIVTGRHLKQQKQQTQEETSTSEQEQIDYDNNTMDDEQLNKDSQYEEEFNEDQQEEDQIIDGKYTEEDMAKFEEENIAEVYEKKDPAKCSDCSETFPSEVRLRHHMMVVHNRLEGTLTCPHCPKRFVNQLRLDTHVLSHTGDSTYKCEICGLNLKTKMQLIKHRQNRHGDEKPLQCSYCPWRCKQISTLVCHEKTHTNEGQLDEEVFNEEQQQQVQHFETKYMTEDHIVKFEAENITEVYEEKYQQEYEETTREASDAAEVIMSMEDTTVYTEEVTAENIETAEIITDEIITSDILQPEITVVHLQQHDDSGKIQVIPVMLSLPDLGDSSTEVNLATASIMYNN